MPDKLTREEYHRLSDEYTRTWMLRELRAANKSVADDSSLEELSRLSRVLRLQGKGVEISDDATLDDVKRLESLKHYITKVAGVTHENKDGTSRQEIIADCYEGESLNLVPEPDNPIDENAIAVCRASGEQIGYLNKGLAFWVSDMLKDGWRYFPSIKAINDDGIDSHNRGVVLSIIAARSNVLTDVIQEFTRSVSARVRCDGERWESNLDAKNARSLCNLRRGPRGQRRDRRRDRRP